MNQELLRCKKSRAAHDGQSLCTGRHTVLEVDVGTVAPDWLLNLECPLLRREG